MDREWQHDSDSDSDSICDCDSTWLPAGGRHWQTPSAWHSLQRSREFWVITVVVVVVVHVVAAAGDAVARVIAAVAAQVAPAERVCIAFELKFDCETKRIENATRTQAHTHAHF